MKQDTDKVSDTESPAPSGKASLSENKKTWKTPELEVLSITNDTHGGAGMKATDPESMRYTS